MNALDYLLKANLYGILFVGTYWLLLRRHTFLGLNRSYLLGAAFLSLFLPLLSLPSQTVETLPAQLPIGIITLPTATVGAVEPVSRSTQPDWESVFLIAYGLIALILVLRFGVRVWRLLTLIRQSPRKDCEHYVLVQPNNDSIPTFSFFQYVVLNPDDTYNELIIQHELVHVRQHHSVDVVFMGITQAVFWACPTLCVMDRLLRQVHEFLADKPAHRPNEYAHFLVAYSLGMQHQPDKLTNSFFNPSLLKQRILMLHQKATSRWALGKYVLVLPLVFGLLAMTTARDELTAVVEQVTSQAITVSGQITSGVDGKPLPGAIVTIANTGKGTPTDAQGHYQLEAVPKTALLSISFVGFTTQVVPVDNRSRINITLKQATADELPVMGATATYRAIRPNPKMPARIPPSSQSVNGQVYTAVEEPAVFPTGTPGLMHYVAHALQYPAGARMAGVQGNVLVQFLVLPTGSIGSATIKKGIGHGCDEEALRIVRQMPHWLPARQNGKAVTAQFVLPIQFVLEKAEDKRTGYTDLPVFRPTDSPIGEFPTVRDVNYPNQPRLTMVKVPATTFHMDTTQAGIGQRPTPVTIRGRGPLGQLSGSPLYILDGNQISADSFKTINPHTFETINVVSGPSAVAAYGEKASDGAIILTTKKR